jgi:undecaprenyl-diphosphatase
MEFLRFLEGLRNPFFDAVMSTVTLFGEETLFMVVGLIFFWCFDKKRGYFLLFAGFTGTVIIQILKMAFRIPRPWVLDPKFTIVESAREAATGYSFPSGHTQCAADLYGGIARSSKRRAIQIGGCAMCVLVALSRMYLGVHTPLDVGVSLLVAAAVIFILYPIVYRLYDQPKKMYVFVGILFLLTLANLLFVSLFPFPADVDAANLADAQKVAWQFFFIILGMCFIYPIDVHVLKFETRAVWWVQLIKLAGGIAILLALRILLKSPFNALFGVNLGSGLRYFLIVIAAGILWPATFRFWNRLAKKP